jgi:hypothetical protein
MRDSFTVSLQEQRQLVQIKQFPETPDPNQSLAHAGKSHREWWQLHLKQLCRHSTNSNSTAPLNTTPGPAPSCQGNGFAQTIIVQSIRQQIIVPFISFLTFAPGPRQAPAHDSERAGGLYRKWADRRWAEQGPMDGPGEGGVQAIALPLWPGPAAESTEVRPVLIFAFVRT